MSSGTVFSAVVKSGHGLFYDCEELTHITNISIAPKSSPKQDGDLSALSKPFLTVLKMQYEGPVIDGQLDEEAEKEALKEAIKNEKKSKKAKQQNDDDDDDDDEDDSDEDFDYVTEAKEAVLGCFTQHTPHLSTNIHLFPGEQYRFLLNGSDLEVHLLGAYIHTSDSDLSYHDSDSEEDSDMNDFDLDQIMDSEEEGSVDESRIQEIDDNDEEPLSSKKKLIEAKKDDKPSKKRALEETNDTVGDISMTDSVTGGEKLSKNQKKKLAKKLKTQESSNSNPNTPSKDDVAAKKPESAKKDAATKKPESSKTITTPSGLKILDSKIGEGAEAKSGQTVSMRYMGKLDNGKLFDKNVKGDPFRFKLGKGEVIKGWDEGIKGMKIGGERKLIVPAALAYGKRGAPPDIPPNATLTFEVKLLGIK